MLHVFTGCQNSGKTQRVINTATLWMDVLDSRGVFIHYKKDVRDEKNIISSNASSYRGLTDKFDVVSVENLMEVFNIIDVTKYSVVCADEIQFYDDIVDFAHMMLDLGIPTFCSGLNSDWRGYSFGKVSELLSIATNFEVLHAKCEWCAEKYKKSKMVSQIPDACRTGKISGSLEIIEIGGKDKYVALCYQCHQQHLRKDSSNVL